jgi:hypothetical protein
MPLKELEVKYTHRRQQPFKLSDGGGLHLLVQPNGSKLWRLKYSFDGKEKLLSFGKYPDVTLAVVREKRREAKAKLTEGIDPGAARADEPAPKKPPPPKTFEAIAGPGMPIARRALILRTPDAFCGAWSATPIPRSATNSSPRSPRPKSSR